MHESRTHEHFQPLQGVVQPGVVDVAMRSAAVNRIVGGVVGIQRAAVDLHMMIKQQRNQIGVAVAAVERAAFAQRDVLKVNVG